MLPISIKFRAFIPKSLGRSLLSYFERDHRFNQLGNKAAFIRRLRIQDNKGVTWLPEPLIGAINQCYFATDNVDFHHPRSKHSVRLGFHAKIEPQKIGNYRITDRIFVHHEHENGWGGINSQHVGVSRRVRAYITRIPFYSGTPRTSDKDVYVGVCDDTIEPKRSDEDPLKFFINNSKSVHSSSEGNDTTTIQVAASSGYPFLEPAAVNIDFDLQIELHKNITNKSIDVHVRGSHNYFPAYELSIGHNIRYNHNPANYGHTGPTPINLSMSKNFSATDWIRLANWQVREVQQGSFRGW